MVDFAFLGAGSRPIIILGVYRGAEETPEIAYLKFRYKRCYKRPLSHKNSGYILILAAT